MQNAAKLIEDEKENQLPPNYRVPKSEQSCQQQEGKPYIDIMAAIIVISVVEGILIGVWL